MEEIELMQQGVDSRALFATFVTKLPKLLILAVTGAVLGSGLRFMIVVMRMQESCYVSETEYYIAFADGQDEARHWYNDFTWNDVIATDLILGRAMELLGDGYERNQVKEMITADILSDVRYLTITVKGQDSARVEAVKDALAAALEAFGEEKKEFASIDKIEDQAIAREEIPYFAWRAAFLGSVLAAGLGVFVTVFCFCMGSEFYTKRDIAVRLGVQVCGMTFREGGRGNSSLEQRQERMLAQSLELLAGKYSRIVLMDASDGREATLFLRTVCDRGLPAAPQFQIYDMERDAARFAQEAEGTAVVAVIPFGKPYREIITDEMIYVQQHGGSVAAAVLARADRMWMWIYYAQGMFAQKDVQGRM